VVGRVGRAVLLSANRDLPPANSRKQARCDEVDLGSVKRGTQVPAMQVGSADRCSKHEVRRESTHEATDWMDMVAKIIDHRIGGNIFFGRAEGAALSLPPSRGGDVEALAVDLIDHWESARLEQRCEMSTGGLQWIDVVQRNHGDGGVKPTVRVDLAELA
jgi:hypothetical protein